MAETLEQAADDALFIPFQSDADELHVNSPWPLLNAARTII